MANILHQILETKRVEVAEARKQRPIDEVRRAALETPRPRDFTAAIKLRAMGEVRLIAEIKKASPSAGVIVAEFDPVAIALEYDCAGAVAISVLTDEAYFGGHLDFLRRVKDAVPLPVLRKDFLIDEYQVYESRVAGADAVLLIAEVLGTEGVVRLLPQARALELSVIVEVHTEQNLLAVVDAIGPPAPDRYVLGINNRDLDRQRTDLSTFSRLARLVPGGVPLVAESGLNSRQDVQAVADAGAWAILVGESILRAPNRRQKVAALLGDAVGN